jgi:hypothetical protein
MSEAGTDLDGQQQRIAQIPSLLTSSLRAVLDAFGANILSLRANGSVETSNATTVEDLREYGLSREQETHHRLTLDYEQIHGDGKPANPLTATACEQLLSEVEAVLNTEHHTVEPDLTVTSLTIRVANSQLQEVTPAQSPEFDLTFVADPAEPPVREPTKRRNAERGLYSDLSFNLTNLNLRSVVETETKFHKQSDGRYLSWGGPEDIRPRAPDRLAIRINNHVLPDEYGILKPYKVTDDSVLELMENDVDDTVGQSAAMDGDV